MIILTSICLLAVTAASANDTVADVYCPSCILMNKACYNISYLFDLAAPFRKQIVIPEMDVLRSKNYLFYSFEPIIEDAEYYKIGFVNLEDPNQAGIINGGSILNLGTLDIDQINEIVYFGGVDGIFVLDTNSNKMSSYSSRGDTITNVFYNNQVYFVKYEDKGIIVKKGDYFQTRLEYWTVKKFVVVEKDNMNFIVFLTNTGLYVSKGNLVNRISKNAYFRGLSVDLEGSVYAWWIDGIYNVVLSKNLNDSKLIRVAKLTDIGALAFDYKNSILFTSDKSLYKMEKVQQGCGLVYN